MSWKIEKRLADMTHIGHILNALGILACLIALVAMVAAAGHVIVGGPLAGPHPGATEKMIEAAQLIESTN